MLETVKKALGIRSKAEQEREKEMVYRMKMAKAHRETATIRKNMEKQEMQAIECEKNGEHSKAVALALQAQKKRKAIENAEAQMQRCTSIHDMAETQRSMTAVLSTCKELSDGIVELADMEGAMKIQAENEEALARLIDTGEQMEMYAEGIGGDVMPEVRNAAGEAALEAILAKQEQPEKIKTASVPQIIPESVPETAQEAEDTWVKSRRENLQALAVDI